MLKTNTATEMTTNLLTERMNLIFLVLFLSMKTVPVHQNFLQGH